MFNEFCIVNSKLNLLFFIFIDFFQTRILYPFFSIAIKSYLKSSIKYTKKIINNHNEPIIISKFLIS